MFFSNPNCPVILGCTQLPASFIVQYIKAQEPCDIGGAREPGARGWTPHYEGNCIDLQSLSRIFRSTIILIKTKMMVELRMQKGVKFTVPAYSRYGVEEKQKFFLKTAGLEKVDTTDYGEHICIRP